MPQNTFQRIIFTAVMAIFMTYGMIVYNISTSLGQMSDIIFAEALHELVIMAPIAFLLELLIADALAHRIAFSFMRADDRPAFIAAAISFCICCIMCPIMSLIATIMFKEPSLAAWIQTWALNLPCALLWQLCFCGPIVRFLFRQRHRISVFGRN